MSQSVRHVSSVAGATMVSRVLGLARDVLMFAGLGAGPYLSAFLLAFTLPNLLRRLLGEGALSSAVIPVLSHQLEQDGKAASFRVLNRVLSRLVTVLLAISLVLGGGLLLLTLWPGAALRTVLGGQLSALLLPYGIFICAAAIISAQLNVLQRFLIPALSPIWLNLVMIAALAIGLFAYSDSPTVRVLLLSGAVLAGGALQMLVPVGALMREGWRPRIDARRGRGVREVWTLFLPGLAGASILQVNLLLSRFLAFAIDDAAVGILYLANRLVELPYGVFAVAVTTVAFPQMARAVARKDLKGFRAGYERGRGAIWLITMPAAVGLVMLARPILEALFQWGLFDAQDVGRTVIPLQLMAVALPFFSWTMLATRGLHSWKEMRLPVRFAGVNALLNLGLGLILMYPLREVGLALANVIASIVFTVLLERALWQRKLITLGRPFWESLWRMAAASGCMALAVWGWGELVDLLGLADKVRAVALVGVGVPWGVAIYFAACTILKVPELKVLESLLHRRRRAE